MPGTGGSVTGATAVSVNEGPPGQVQEDVFQSGPADELGDGPQAGLMGPADEVVPVGRVEEDAVDVGAAGDVLNSGLAQTFELAATNVLEQSAIRTAHLNRPLPIGEES